MIKKLFISVVLLALTSCTTPKPAPTPFKPGKVVKPLPGCIELRKIDPKADC